MKKNSIFAPFKGWKYLFKKPVTIPMDDIFKNPRESQNNYRGFHVNDWDKCIGCATCSEVCPTNAISMAQRAELPDVPGSLPQRPVVDYGRCCFCALCVDICTTGSLNLTKEYLFNSPDPEDFLYMPGATDITEKENYKLGYVKDETSDILDLKRREMHELSTQERQDSFIEIVRGFSKEQAKAESARCVECGICTKTCPAHMNIPEYIRSVWTDNIEEGVNWLYQTNPLPSVCGRVCTHKCESVCAISHRGDAIAIRWLKRYLVDNMPDEEYKKVVLSQVSKKGEGKVAIIGSGASGLSAAYYLTTLGYEVDVIEKSPLAGGPMRYGIPRYRLPDTAIDRDISFIESLGAKIYTNREVGKDVDFLDLKEHYDAVFLATGYPNTRPLDVEGADHDDVKMAMEFLQQANDYNRGVGEMPDIKDQVVVIGSGNVAFDVARTMVRLQNEKFGKNNVMMMALESADQIPADPDEVREGTEEGIKMTLSCGPQSIGINENGEVTSVNACVCTQLFDEEKRFNPQFDYESKVCVMAKQVYLAIGQMPDLTYIPDEIMKQMTVERGKVKVGAGNQVEGLPWLFAGGDIVRGMDVINGVADGHNAAIAIDEYLSNKK